MKNIYRRLKQIRLSLKQTQEVFSSILGVSNSTYSTIERGTRKLKLEEAAKICESFDITLDWLLLGRGQIFSFNKGRILLEDIINEFFMAVKDNSASFIVHNTLIDILKTTDFNKNKEEAKIHLYFKIDNFSYNPLYNVKSQMVNLLTLDELQCTILLENKSDAIYIIQNMIITHLYLQL